MISDKDIRKGFRKKLLALGIPEVDVDGKWANVSLENRNFTPPKDASGNDKPFYRGTLIPSFQRQISTGYSRTQGFYQLDFFVPANSGAYDADDMADSIKNNFINATLDGGIKIYRTERESGQQQPDFYMVSISLYYRLTRKTAV